MAKIKEVNEGSFLICRHPRHFQFQLGHFYVFLVFTTSLCILFEAGDCSSKSEQKKKSNNKREVIQLFGVNAGGGEHTDVHGIRYHADPLKTGVASDFGMRLNSIGRAHSYDEILYRTERYSASNFGYTFSIDQDGSYVLVLKFCEVYFQHAGQKVFDVTLNDKHVIVADLDIFAAVGFGNVHQEVIPFTVSEGGKKLTVEESTSEIRNKQIKIEFVKGRYDNPKVNALYIIKGDVSDIPPLPELPQPQGSQEEMYDDDDEFDEEYYEMDGGAIPEQEPLKVYQRPSQRRYKKSRSGVDDPWEDASVFTTIAPLLSTVLIGAGIVVVLWKTLRNL